MKKYLVGGAVRDELLQLPVIEKDWVVVGTTPQEMIAHGYQQVGKNFPVFIHPKSREEYALARLERKSGYGHTGFICVTSPLVTLEEDLRRRDLTINAMARDEIGNLIDPYQGKQDLCQRLLRHVSDAFSEDSLRVLRVARFAARFAHLKFKIAPATLILMQKMTSELSLLAPERIWKETEKALITKNPQIYFQVLHDCGALEILFPELNTLFSISKSIKSNQENNMGINTLITVSIVASISEDIIVRFAALCLNLGNNLNSLQLWNSNHHKNTAKIIDKMCRRLKVPNTLRNVAKIVAQYNYLLHVVNYLTPKTLIKLFNAIDIWRKPQRLEQMIIICEADARRRIGCAYHDNLFNIFLRNAYYVVTRIKVYEIFNKNLNMENIKERLNLERQRALTIWKQKKDKNNKY